MTRQIADITGRTLCGAFVLGRANSESPNPAWHVRFACGHEGVRTGIALRFYEKTGTIARCTECRPRFGSRRRHGETAGLASDRKKSKEYGTWLAIRGRCNTELHPAYARYGGRGIRVAPEWDTFEAFLADIGRAPSAAHTIERLDNNKGYEPRNCVWATRLEQAQNTSLARRISAFGKCQSAAAWARESGVAVATLTHRIDRWGLPPEVALVLRPRAKHAERDALLRAHGQMKNTVSQIASGGSQ